MAEPAQSYVEVLGLVVDHTGIWMRGDEAWRSRTPVMADTGPFGDVDTVLYEHNVRPAEVRLLRQVPAGPRLLHSTSWRWREPRLVLTFVAAMVCEPPALVADRWPDDPPIDVLRLLEHAGRPATHAAAEPPAVVRDLDVLLHAIRHLAFLVRYDATAARDLGELWRQWLAPIEPALAGMYAAEHSEPGETRAA